VIRAGGTLVTITGPTEARPAAGLAVDFVVVSDRAQLSEIVRRMRDGRLRTNIGNISTLDDAVAAFNRTERRKGKTIIRVRPRRTPIDARGRPARGRAAIARWCRQNCRSWCCFMTEAARISSRGRPATHRRWTMKAIVVTDQAAGTAGMKLAERPQGTAPFLVAMQ